MTRWTKEEETELLESLKINTPIEEIALKHGRTIGGISSRQRHIAREMVRNGMTLEEASRLVYISTGRIQQSIKASHKSIERHRVKKEETMVDIMRDVRSLLQKMVKTQGRILSES